MTRPLLPLALTVLTACTASHTPDPTALLAAPLDSTVAQQARQQQAVAQLLQTGKVKVARGGVLVLQLGTGNTATPTLTDNTRAGSKQGSAAVGAGAVAGNASKRTAGGTPWQVYLLVAALGAAAWEWLSSKLPLGWLRWRARPG